MEKDFWLERWHVNKIGFHQSDYNPYLVRHWHALQLEPGARVFVPLCGKSRDLTWLAQQGYEVLGVELSKIAVCDYFAEQGMSPQCRREGDLLIYRQWPVSLYCGDFFHLHVGHLEGIQGIFDRAALVALPPSMRQRYAFHLAQLIYPGTQMLLVTLEYAENQHQRPPFSVREEEVQDLFGCNFKIRCLERVQRSINQPFQGEVSEAVYHLERKGQLENIGRYS